MPWLNVLPPVAMEDKEFFSRSREFMFHGAIAFIQRVVQYSMAFPYKPTANYIFVKINISYVTSPLLRERLLGHGIAIRDCSNFIGLNDNYFRIAVRTREENTMLIAVLKSVTDQAAKMQKCLNQHGIKSQ